MAIETEPRTVAILGAARTPIGRYRGELAACTAPQLGAAALRGALCSSGADAGQVDDCTMGCVLPAGLGQAPARQASLAAGISQSAGCATINKMCGSGMHAVMLAVSRIRAGEIGVAAAGGMESMSGAPYLTRRDRSTGRPEEGGPLVDHMRLDGLEDAYESGRSMGEYAEECAEQYQFTREMQDNYAAESLLAVRRAEEAGAFAREVVPVDGKEGMADSDELPRTASLERIASLPPAFREGGTVTAANASAVSDGAAALVLASIDEASRIGAAPRAIVRGQATHAQQPQAFATAPAPAILKLMDSVGWTVESVDLWEVNEAFAVVPMAAMAELGIPRDRLNVRGGACALGHPIGASGARILVTLLHAMEDTGARRGVAAICIGGGEATAMALELP